MRRHGRTTGVTLVESMIATFSMPSFVEWRQRDQVEARARAMVAALAAARAESMTRGTRVALCRSNGVAACAPAGLACDGAGRDWSCAWAIVALDKPGMSGMSRAHTSAAQAGAPSGGRVLRRLPSDPGVRVEGAAPDIVFTPPAGQIMGGFRRFEFSPRTLPGRAMFARAWRCLRIAAGGRARLSVGRCGAGE
ncbi:MAG: hypothetical protein GAK40_01400 [Burkholderia plantarii]|nr:MAG: hypothetical protein GAK40_01400 [Burkholderia plantarii]